MNPFFLTLLLLSGGPEPSPPPILHGVRTLGARLERHPEPAAERPGDPNASLTPTRAHAYFPAPEISLEYSQ
ncbi:MAG: hypothetical protein GXP55_03925 [Deltaproteobacteria bacterium]|nr:hypothetical protein [Deltaproteobacteria bacterium]